MWIIGAVAGVAIILLILIDGFETILQPRRVTHRFRFARLFFRATWRIWRAIVLRVPAGRKRESVLGVFGPLLLLGLFGTWVMGLVFGFALLHWSLGTMFRTAEGDATPFLYVYMSGTTFFTLGYGDFTPVTSIGRWLAVIESGMGFAFLAVVIGYLPVLHQAFSLREVTISLLDARAGSPPGAVQALCRAARAGQLDAMDSVLAGWERWAAELLESHLSFPLLSYYRSQHDNQSWLAALTCMLDTCALLIVKVKSRSSYQAQLTFAMARHAAVDLALVLKAPPSAPDSDRLPDDRRQRMGEMLREAGLELLEGPDVDAKLTELREMYEPFIHALARRLMFAVPPMMPDGPVVDNWQSSKWTRRTPGIGKLSLTDASNEHFD